MKRILALSKTGVQSKFFYFLLFSAFLLFIYSFFIEPELLDVTYIKIDILAGNGSIKIIHLSDIHIAERFEFMERVVSMANSLEPDVILLTGDYIFAYEYEIEGLEVLKKLKGKAKYAVLGNHDYGIVRFAPHLRNESLADKVEEKLEEMGIIVLRNEIETIEINGYKIQIAGLDDFWAGKSDYEKIKDEVNKNIPFILLSHEQQAVENFDVDVDLVLSGHTHGGQVVLPFIGSVPKLLGFDGKYPSGLHKEGNYWLYVNKGVGGRPRFLCRPEITVLELT